MRIIIDKKTPTISRMYWQRGVVKVLTTEAKEIRKYIDACIKAQCGSVDDLKDRQLSITVWIYEDWFTLKGDVKKKDISNREKFLIDSVFNSLGLEDKYIWEHKMIKVDSKIKQAIIEIETFK